VLVDACEHPHGDAKSDHGRLLAIGCGDNEWQFRHRVGHSSSPSRRVLPAQRPRPRPNINSKQRGPSTDQGINFQLPLTAGPLRPGCTTASA
jgi:hypothetical protein